MRAFFPVVVIACALPNEAVGAVFHQIVDSAHGARVQPAEELDTDEDREQREEASTDDEEEPPAQPRADRVRFAHGIGVRSGLTVVPAWLIGAFTASHTNSLCRGTTIGASAAGRGLTKQKGCNFYVGGEYIYRRSRVFDIVASVGWQRAHTPDGYWLSDSDYDPNDPRSLSSADFTRNNLGFVFLEADFIGRVPIQLHPDVELQLGGGGGIGVGIITGKIRQTPIGAGSNGRPGPNCPGLASLSDFTQCTPQWDGSPPTVEASQTKGDGTYALCSGDSCEEADLRALGTKIQEDIPPVIPVVNLILNARLLITEQYGLVLQGGFNTGFYFGGGFQYFIGKNK